MILGIIWSSAKQYVDLMNAEAWPLANATHGTPALGRTLERTETDWLHQGGAPDHPPAASRQALIAPITGAEGSEAAG